MFFSTLESDTRMLSRRSFLAASAIGIPVVAGCSPGSGDTPSPDVVQTPMPLPDGQGQRPISAALHVHSCFSEGPGSMQAQLAEATRLGVDVIWWTDHDWRMQATGYVSNLTFVGDNEDGKDKPIIWRAQESREQPQFGSGPSASGSGKRSDSIFLSHTSESDSPTEYRVLAVADRETYRTSLAGQRIEFDVFPENIANQGSLFVDVVTSFRPATADRKSGTYRLSYRFTGGSDERSTQTNGLTGVIKLPAPANEWTRVSITPATDLSDIWPDLNGLDASTFEIAVGVTGSTTGYVASMTIDRPLASGQKALQTQADLMEHYRAQYPAVTQLPGLEVSLDNPHFGVYGGELTIPIKADATPQGRLAPKAATALADELRGYGSLICYNHPFGTSAESASAAQQAKRITTMTAELLKHRAAHCELMEVGYRERGGVDLAGHTLLWDACSAAGLFLTGIGVNDNHTGTGWDTNKNNFLTWIWSEVATGPALMEALASGHAYFGDPVLFTGALDLSTPAGVRMGQVGVRQNHGKTLQVLATDLPPGSRVELLSLPFDDSPSARNTPPTDSDYTRTEVDAADITGGRFEVAIDGANSSMHRAVVRDTRGDTIALSNPIWLLTDTPNADIPAARQP